MKRLAAAIAALLALAWWLRREPEATAYLRPRPGPRAKCPECSSELLGEGRLIHGPRGMHTFVPSHEAAWGEVEDALR